MAFAKVLRVLQASFAASVCLLSTAEQISCQSGLLWGTGGCASSGRPLLERLMKCHPPSMPPYFVLQSCPLLRPELVSLRQICSGILVLYGEYWLSIHLFVSLRMLTLADQPDFLCPHWLSQTWSPGSVGFCVKSADGQAPGSRNASVGC